MVQKNNRFTLMVDATFFTQMVQVHLLSHFRQNEVKLLWWTAAEWSMVLKELTPATSLENYQKALVIILDFYHKIRS